MPLDVAAKTEGTLITQGSEKKVQLPGLHPRVVESKGREGSLFATSFPVILMLEPLAWQEVSVSSVGPGAPHICL